MKITFLGVLALVAVGIALIIVMNRQKGSGPDQARPA